jgi:large subunit ribosomal protein L4
MAENKAAMVRELTDMIAVPVVSKTGTSVGSVEIDPSEFGGKINRTLLHDACLMYLANQRGGNASTLRRGEVAGSSKKVFKQKGTGNARVGTKRTNKRRGGGTSKGPKPRDYEYHMPKKAVRAATRMAILSKLADGEAVVIDDFALTGPKTKEMAGVLKAIKVGQAIVKKLVNGVEQNIEKDVTLLDTTVLIGTESLDLTVFRSGRNIEGVKILPAGEFNAYIVLKQKRLVLTRAALQMLRDKGKVVEK